MGFQSIKCDNSFLFQPFFLKIFFIPRLTTSKKLNERTILLESTYLFIALNKALLSRDEKIKLPFFLVTTAKRGIHFPLNITEATTLSTSSHGI